MFGAGFGDDDSELISCWPLRVRLYDASIPGLFQKMNPLRLEVVVVPTGQQLLSACQGRETEAEDEANLALPLVTPLPIYSIWSCTGFSEDLDVDSDPLCRHFFPSVCSCLCCCPSGASVSCLPDGCDRCHMAEDNSWALLTSSQLTRAPRRKRAAVTRSPVYQLAVGKGRETEAQKLPHHT